MITGVVSSSLAATIPLVVQDTAGGQHQLQATIDSGFNGFLTLHPAQIAALGLPWLYRQQGLLADGSVQVFDVYKAMVIWDGRPRSVEVEAVAGHLLVGMGLLEGSELRIKVVIGGGVTVDALP